MTRPNTGVSRKSGFSHPPHQKYSEKDDNALVQINKKCISCSDNPGKLIQLFKLACLTYFPGKVNFKGGKFNRTELIDKLSFHTIELYDHLEETKRKFNELIELINQQRP